MSILLAGWATTALASALGTLFHTPEERERLDRLRRGEVPQAEAAPAPPPHDPELTGFVKRSDGRNTVWIDGRPVPVATPKAAPLFDPRAVRDRAPGNGSVRIEPTEPVKR